MDKSLGAEQQIYTLLLQRDFSKLVDLCEENRRAWRILWGTLYHPEEYLRWPAIEGVAVVMGVWWREGNEEKVREYIRRMQWSMCDEAGEMGWSAPQTIAEIIVTIPELIEPYSSMMVSRALEELSLVAGGLWGIGRLGARIKEVVESSQDRIFELFQFEDVDVPGLAAWAMGEVCFDAALPYLEGMKNRPEPVKIYIDGEFIQKTVGQWAEEAIEKINMHSMDV